MGVYHPTGYNENFMYLNMGMQTMPNGLVSNADFFKLTWLTAAVLFTSLSLVRLVLTVFIIYQMMLFSNNCF